jgi:hypothetical protein
VVAQPGRDASEHARGNLADRSISAVRPVVVSTSAWLPAESPQP